MDFFTVVIAVCLTALGAGAVWWPMSLMLKVKDTEIARLKSLAGAASEMVQTERIIDAARDLAPLDELGVLLDGNDLAGVETPGKIRT